MNSNGVRRGGRTALAAFVAAVAAVASLGARATRTGQPWYRGLRKPPFNPPGWVFGPVWTALYGLISFSGWRVWRRPSSASRSEALALWAAQLALNGAWSPLFFGARKPRAAMADLAALALAIAAYTYKAQQVDRPAAWMMAPYLGWVSFAGALNEEIARRN